MTLIEEVTTWVDVCAVDDLLPNRGACAYVPPHQIALFRLHGEGEVFALSNLDPFSQAYVLSRGIVGCRNGIDKVASPVYKQSFDLRTGACLDDPTVAVPTFPVRLVDGRVEVGLP
jgi:nitrite reductase (NADH) small subunit